MAEPVGRWAVRSPARRSTGECDAMGGFGNGDAGCGAACFCCKQPRILPTCETAGTVAMSYCLAKHDGLCMATSDDCDAVGGDFSDSGCGDDCGCCLWLLTTCPKL